MCEERRYIYLKNKKIFISIISVLILAVMGIALKDNVFEFISEESISSQTESFSEYTEPETEYTEEVQTTAVSSAVPETSHYVSETATEDNDIILESGSYTTPENVAEYIHTFGTLPCNFITKDDAIALGWDKSKGNLWEVADGMSIGGDRFGNFEGLLPDSEGRYWTECDVNYQGGFRGAERIIFSNDGLIFYTNDHYQTFKQLY